ncbi:MAG: WxcM-like domain-containing protein [Flavobacteriaceae bacterium]|nr:WxcM-like domain-containing protein [Flavobacteriaceae bacterium]
MLNKSSSIDDCGLFQLPKVHNRSGNLSSLENNTSIPFEVKRVYYLYDVPSNQERGGHAHYELYQFLVAASGSFSVVLSDGNSERTVILNRPDKALHIVPGIWREIKEFSGGSICLVLASEKYNEKDYIRDYTEFIEWKSQK